MIKSIKIQNFMAHTQLLQTELPRINLLIGKNDTGKTGLLKLLYALVKSLEQQYKQPNNALKKSLKNVLAEKLQTTFMPTKNGLGELVQKGAQEKLKVELLFSSGYSSPISFTFGEKSKKEIQELSEPILKETQEDFNALFLPAKELLTAFNDIRNIREKLYGTGFDDTYYDLTQDLLLPPRSQALATPLGQVEGQLEALFEGKIEQTKDLNQPFIFKKGNQVFSMHQTSEGIKKIGILNTLLKNGQLHSNSILFLDEPETALHPDAIRQLVEMLVSLSKAGVQVFMASHSFFVLKQLALCAQREKLDALCWNLHRKQGAVCSEFINLKAGILPRTGIVEESFITP